MKVVQINACCGVGSTGKICKSISELLISQQHESNIIYSYPKSDYTFGIQNTTKGYIKLQALKSKILGNYGFNSKRATEKLIRQIDLLEPDIVHLHNIHGHDCNLEMLCRYLRKRNIKTVWTFHDCWAFTAYCTHFTMAKCDKWKDGCFSCPNYRKYSWIVDRSRDLYARKKACMDGLDLTVVTPSQWLADLVKLSFFKDYPVKVINNGIDLSIFSPTESNFREKYGIGDSHIVLGVASCWDERKGLDVLIELSKRLGDRYRVVIVGTDDSVDAQLPDNIVSIHRTNNQQELAEIYSAADVFANPTREEVLGLVNVESLACGTPVVTFNTGGSPECIDESCGITVPCNDVDAMEKAIRECCENHLFPQENCVNHARSFDSEFRFKEYVELYKSIQEKNK